MAFDIDISMLGDKQLAKQLKALEGPKQKKVVRQAYVKGAAVFRKSIRSLTPVDTGALKKAIKSYAGKGKKGQITRFVGIKDRASLGIEESSKYYYPAAVEYGHEGVSAKSYLRAGYDAVEEQVFALVKRLIGAGIERVAKGA